MGNIPVDGLESLAAAGIVGSFLSMLIWVLGQTRSSISAIISQYLGAGRLDEVKTCPHRPFSSTSFWVLWYCSPLSLWLKRFLHSSMHREKSQVLCFLLFHSGMGFPLTLFTFAVFGIFRGLQNTFYPMVIAMLGAGLNILLDFALVYGIDGFIPALYLEGAAWASLISQAIMAILALVLLVRKTDISMKLTLPWTRKSSGWFLWASTYL